MEGRESMMEGGKNRDRGRGVMEREGKRREGVIEMVREGCGGGGSKS